MLRDETTGRDLSGETAEPFHAWAIEERDGRHVALLRAPQIPDDEAREFVAHLRANGEVGEYRCYPNCGPTKHCGIYGVYLEWCAIERRTPIKPKNLLSALKAVPGVVPRLLEADKGGKRYRPTVIAIGEEPARARRRKAA